MACCYQCSVVCVCVLVTAMIPTKTAWDMAYCYQCSVVCLCVCWSQPWSLQKQHGIWPIVTNVPWFVCVCVGHNRDPYKNSMGYGLLLPVFRGLFVCVLVSTLVIAVIPTKTAELTEVMFEMWTQMDPRNRVLCGGPDSSRWMGNSGDISSPLWSIGNIRHDPGLFTGWLQWCSLSLSVLQQLVTMFWP